MHHLFYKRKKLTPEQESNACRKCQYCCRWLLFFCNFDNPEYLKLIQRWGVPFFVESGGITIRLPFPCQHLDENEGCKIYDNRPSICRAYRGGDFDPETRPFCSWYEPVSSEERIYISKNFKAVSEKQRRIDAAAAKKVHDDFLERRLKAKVKNNEQGELSVQRQ